MPLKNVNMEATANKKKENPALYIVYAAAAYFGLQLILKPKRATAAAIVTYPASEPVQQTTTTSPVTEPVTDPVATAATWIAERFPLRKGMKGTKIKALQQKLGVSADGAFGNNTETALLKKFGISTVSQAQYQSITAGQTNQSGASNSAAATEGFPLRKGMKGARVKALQQKLGITADGAFGKNTEAALISKYGVNTVSEDLFRSITQPVTTTFTNLLNLITPKTSGTRDTSAVLKSGSRGSDVYRLQKWLGFKDKAAAKKGEPVADSIFGNQTLVALQKKTGASTITVDQLNARTKPLAGMGYAGEILVTKRAVMILDSNLLPHRTVPENTILGTRMMELTDPQEQKAYTQFKTVDGFHRWVDKDAV